MVWKIMVRIWRGWRFLHFIHVTVILSDLNLNRSQIWNWNVASMEMVVDFFFLDGEIRQDEECKKRRKWDQEQSNLWFSSLKVCLKRVRKNEGKIRGWIIELNRGKMFQKCMWPTASKEVEDKVLILRYDEAISRGSSESIDWG